MYLVWVFLYFRQRADRKWRELKEKVYFEVTFLNSKRS